MNDIQASFSQLQIPTPIQDLVDICTFMNPAEDSVQDTMEDVDGRVLAQYMPEIEEDSDEEIEILPKVSAEEAITAIQKLRLYEEQRWKGILPLFVR